MSDRTHPVDIDRDHLLDTLELLLRTPSPTGRTDQVIQLVGEQVAALGLTSSITRRGALRIDLPGRREDRPGVPGGPERAIVAHVDTLGCMVKALKEDGRLQVVPIGTHSSRFAEGARVTIFTDDVDAAPIVGTILPLLASGHRWHRQVDTQPVGWEHVEVRVDEDVASAADLRALGIHVGDFVALDAVPVRTASGYVCSRHLDDKAGVAAVLAALEAMTRAGQRPEVATRILFTISEEVGHGASHGLGPDVAELVAVDNSVVATGQASIERGVTIAMQDLHGPFDYHLTRRLLELCDRHGIPVARDVYDHYRSDAAAALEAGLATRAALMCFGLDASHGFERTHGDSLVHVAELLVHYLASDLTFGDWDRTPEGPLEEFPSTSVQPAPVQGPR